MDFYWSEVDLKEAFQVCRTEWEAVLKHFGIHRPIQMQEETQLAQSIQRFGWEWVKMALVGATRQKKTESFDPSQFVSLSNYLHPEKIQRLVNLGGKKQETVVLHNQIGETEFQRDIREGRITTSQDEREYFLKTIISRMNHGVTNEDWRCFMKLLETRFSK